MIQRPLSVFDFGIRGVAHGVHGAQRLKPDDYGPGKEIRNPHVKMKGRFKIQVRRHGQLIREQEFDNLILNQGLQYLGISKADALSWVHIGTGTSIPNATQTALDAFTACSNGVGVNPAGTVYTTTSRAGSPTYVTTVTAFYQFNQGAVVGNMSEIGVSSQQTTGGLFSRALITDSGGNPTTITVTSIDQVSVYYSISFYPSMTPVAGSVVLAGTTYTYTSYMTNMNSFAAVSNPSIIVLNSSYPFLSMSQNQGGVVPAGFSPAGTPLSPTVTTDTTPANYNPVSIGNSSIPCTTAVSYTSGSYFNTVTLTVPAISANLTGGIQQMFTGFQFLTASSSILTGFNTLFYFDTPIPKTNTKQMQLLFRTSWGV